ncbi:MAG: hypothetical protein RL243_1155 [Actinomycetota bacterium]|jgi:cellulose synthase (UDP-forming)
MPQVTIGEDSVYAPLPASVTATHLGFGSWFQTRPRYAQALALLAIGAGLYYLSWRLYSTLPQANPIFFWILFAAELFGFVTFAIHTVEAWSIPPTPRPPVLGVPVDVLITTYNEDVDIVLPTLLGAKLLRGQVTIWLCDDGRREEFKQLAAEYGVQYHTRPDNRDAKAGNINSVLPKLSGELLLVLDADHVPSPDFLEATSGYFADPKIAVIQSAHSFRNHNSVMHSEKGRHEQSMFFDILLPGRNRLKSAFWCGSAALIRRSALQSVGGMATYTSTEDFETSLKLQIAGYEIRYHNEHLIQGLAPDNLESYTIQRFRWAEGYLSSFAKGRRLALSPKLSKSQRLSYIGGVLYYLTPLQRIIYIGLLLSVVLFGVRPFGTLNAQFLPTWGAWALLSLIAGAALDRGVSNPIESIKNSFIIFEACLKAIPALWVKRPMKFHVTPKNEVDLGGWPVLRILAWPLVLYAVTLVALGIRIYDMAIGLREGKPLLPPVQLASIEVGAIFAIFESSVLAVATVKFFRRKQYRSLWRFPVNMNASIKNVPTRAVDLHHRGVGVRVYKAEFPELKLGDSIAMKVECRLLSGQNTWATGRLKVAFVAPDPQDTAILRVGGKVEWENEEGLDAVVEHCYVVEPYLARNRAWSRITPRTPVSLPAKISGQPVRMVDLSPAGAALVGFKGEVRVGDLLPVQVSIDHHQAAVGQLQVRNVSRLDNGQIRVGGLTYWQETDWMQNVLPLVVQPAA